jgi:hypothetical protein
MGTMSEESAHTTLWVRKDTAQQFKEAKPYDSMSADEFVDVLLDKWEGRR